MSLAAVSFNVFRSGMQQACPEGPLIGCLPCGDSVKPWVPLSNYSILHTPGSPIFKAVQKKWSPALYRVLAKSPTAPEYTVGAGSEPSYVARSVGTP